MIKKLILLVALNNIIRWSDYENALKYYPTGDLDLVKPIRKYTICNYIFILSIPICEAYLVLVRHINKRLLRVNNKKEGYSKWNLLN